MPSITLPNEITFTYTDSGSPLPSPHVYKTILFIHGISYHSGIFSRLSQHSSQYGVRVIALNRRGYKGSTPYLDFENPLILNTNKEDRGVGPKMKWIIDQGWNIILFISLLIQETQLEGEIILCGWSLGSLFTLSAIAALDAHPINHTDSGEVQRVRTQVRKHIHRFILYDPTIKTLSIPIPAHRTAYDPLEDLAIPERARGIAFGVWIASYFQHQFPSISLNTDNQDELFAALSQKNPLASPPATNATFTYKDYMNLLTISPQLEASDRAITAQEDGWGEVAAQLRDRYILPLDVTDATESPTFQPHLIYGTHSAWSCVYPAWLLKSRLSYVANNARALRVRELEGANHFMMWDLPGPFLAAIQAILDEV